MVVAMGIPMSFMIGLIATEMIGYSLNMLSLLGALIALGMLVDEAIVVAENIYRHMEEGMSQREAAVQGAVEMFPAVLTATLTTVFAFLPMLMITGDVHQDPAGHDHRFADQFPVRGLFLPAAAFA
jgi:multidrug efflux pump subunit AcrB